MDRQHLDNLATSLGGKYVSPNDKSDNNSSGSAPQAAPTYNPCANGQCDLNKEALIGFPA